MTTTTRSRSGWAIVILALVLGACLTGVGGSGSDPPQVTRSSQGPFVDSDPDGLVVEAHRLDPSGATPALEHPIFADQPPATIIESGADDTVRIAVNGNGCVPEVHLALAEDGDTLRIRVVVSDAVPDSGLVCEDLLTTHAFDIRLDEPVGEREVGLSVDR